MIKKYNIDISKTVLFFIFYTVLILFGGLTLFYFSGIKLEASSFSHNLWLAQFRPFIGKVYLYTSSILGLIFLYYLGQNKILKTYVFWENLALIFWILGFSNFLTGIVNSLLGLLLPFILGSICLFIVSIKNQEWHNTDRTRPRYFLLATFLFFIGQVVLLLFDYSDLAFSHFRRQIWIFVVPLLMFLVVPSQQFVRRFFSIALHVVVVFLLMQILVYITTCLAYDFSLFSALTLSKSYFVLKDDTYCSRFMLSLMGFDHYTFIAQIFLLPIVYIFFNNTDKNKSSKEIFLKVFLSLLVLSYIFIYQSRIMMIFFSFFLMFCLLKNIWKRSYLKFFLIVIGIGVLCSIAVLFIYPDLPLFFIDGHRLVMYKTAIESGMQAFFKGWGIGSSNGIVRPVLLALNNPQPHFHNQFLQQFSESGVFSFLFMLMIPISYFYEVIKRRNMVGCMYGVLFTLILLIDIITYLVDYEICILISLCIPLMLIENKKRIKIK